jgi:hypothetical protein
LQQRNERAVPLDGVEQSAIVEIDGAGGADGLELLGVVLVV